MSTAPTTPAYALAMRVLQSDLDAKLDDLERAEYAYEIADNMMAERSRRQGDAI